MIRPDFARIPWRTLLIAAGLAVALLALLSWRAACAKAASEGDRAGIAVATGTALDKVAADTQTIREEQKDKEDAVDQIPGADQRLPDGFGAGLERVRRGQQPAHP